ncbi:DUF4998 domain-containing protein [Pedobacter sp.]|jgi:hypothetical protein|uniref:DUF4998 domain-containing protein n=1 Tax=Pedobacter sp. TaxID=1411316 RepID=UPI002CE96028|nr:DUF4998 domain-containing protein [Pedobacter sp.]HWW40208.1 DUF4998 domain-containing protein [Pedobacter sp.]
MKTKIYYLLLVIICFSSINACKKMDSTYKQFIVNGGKYYPGKANNPKFQSGNQRGRIVWPNGVDPNAIKARIFWNNYKDSVEVPTPKDKDSISYLFTNLPENFYSFVIKTYDNKGNVSVPVEVPGAVYGETYQSRLLDRPLKESLLNVANELSVTWETADIAGGAVATEIEYTNTQGALKVKRFPTTSPNTDLQDYKVGTPFRYRTVYRPDSTAIDLFYTPYKTNETFFLDKKEWKIIDFSTQHPGDENKVINFIDGDPATRWHTDAWNSHYPHFCNIDMGAQRIINKIGLWRMKDDDRAPDRVQFLTSADNVNWVDQGVFNFNRQINDEQVFNMPVLKNARYFKVVGISGPQSYMVMGEVRVYTK